mmetsp:Transcript_9565/g.17130  ORF Transcript_9565/g.17130 Transcript_9565/m.17130 type:complete len:510 (-) Transcript_9565:154-1683(-)|eukprot:CAMPEP_0197622850 /NCGR_PEP_ID=MMETSP1338-20131121/2975_1 /TAXON_ID=43686 ORGANISM="Pelagodinium beii, Strain RCC1491" /NCGR_SAMPLE_ID=MMETSP1338 /ASSEMBLY_ACC=CAM_ASM_000754 /LENGTH=509 /DNA_ID=CAMNT_0043192617 /DNA_START=65 /DNA_END=1594 /DNA_ORIENTATION=+
MSEMTTQSVVVRNTFLEVGDQQPLQKRSESFRRQVSEPVKIFSSPQQKVDEEEEDSDDDFAAPASTSSQLRADAPVFEAPPKATDMWQGAEESQSGAYGGKRSQGKGRGKQDAHGAQVRGSQDQRELPRRVRDGQLSRLKNENITQLEPPWDDVTTVMMRNLPNKYTQQMLLGELRDAGFQMQVDFDFFYLPMDHSNCANLGYCFVNFTETSRANDFAAAFSGKRMRRFNSHKTAVIMPASIQGYEQNYTYYISTRVAQAADPQYRPLFLRPLPAMDLQATPPPVLPAAPTGKAGKGKGEKDQKGGKDGTGKGKTGRKERRNWDGEAGEHAAGDWSLADEAAESQIASAGGMPGGAQEYQVMCVACGTLCGANYRFCSFCGNFLCDSAAAGGPMMMATYFQPTDWPMMTELPQMQMQTRPAEQFKKNKKTKPSSQLSKAAAKSSQEAVAEELDILHGRMMLLAALKVVGNQEEGGGGGHCDTPMSSEDENFLNRQGGRWANELKPNLGH